jgi:hypothetical protein
LKQSLVIAKSEEEKKKLHEIIEFGSTHINEDSLRTAILKNYQVSKTKFPLDDRDVMKMGDRRQPVSLSSYPRGQNRPESDRAQRDVDYQKDKQRRDRIRYN